VSEGGRQTGKGCGIRAIQFNGFAVLLDRLFQLTLLVESVGKMIASLAIVWVDLDGFAPLQRGPGVIAFAVGIIQITVTP
jgi:hypothetical protein